MLKPSFELTLHFLRFCKSRAKYSVSKARGCHSSCGQWFKCEAASGIRICDSGWGGDLSRLQPVHFTARHQCPDQKTHRTCSSAQATCHCFWVNNSLRSSRHLQSLFHTIHAPRWPRKHKSARGRAAVGVHYHHLILDRGHFRLGAKCISCIMRCVCEKTSKNTWFSGIILPGCISHVQFTCITNDSSQQSMILKLSRLHHMHQLVAIA